jgi:RHS repeat-associated protein
VYVYGVDGQKIGTYTFTLGQYGEGNTPEMTNSTVLLATFFVHKRIGVFDRLGSAKYNQQNNQAQSFYPYGEDRGTVEPNDALKFATYTRDAATGLDYADQRYYASNFGRFMSPDRYRASGGATDPGSWNRYDYTRGDPVNRNDRSGRFDCDPDDDACSEQYDSNCGANWMADASLQGPCDDYDEVDEPTVGRRPNPCPGILLQILQTLAGVGMPGGKSLLTRVVQQVTSSPALFPGHQEQIDNYRNKLNKLINRWDDADCDPPGGPPGLSDLIDLTDGPSLWSFQQDYQQFVQDLWLIATGAGTAAIYSAVGALSAAIQAFFAELSVDLVLIPLAL